VTLGDGNPVGIQGIARDITEREQAETALRESERRFRALTEYAADAIALLDAGGKILYASPSTNRLTGYDGEQRVGRSGFEHVHPEDWERIRALFADLLSHPGGQATAQLRYEHKDGSWLWLEAVATNLLTSWASGPS
jgi:PAS domain S-box-containing protein